jgi:hypothetical protein
VSCFFFFLMRGGVSPNKKKMQLMFSGSLQTIRVYTQISFSVITVSPSVPVRLNHTRYC